MRQGGERQRDRGRDKDFPTAAISNLNACVMSLWGFIKWGLHLTASVCDCHSITLSSATYSSRNHADLNKRLRQTDGLQVSVILRIEECEFFF